MSKETGGTAFPMPIPAPNGEPYQDGLGMTLRDWFAGMALQGILSSGKEEFKIYGTETYMPNEKEIRSRLAYEYADAMLKARGE